MACNGDITQITCSSIGADVSGSAATAQSNAESFATSAVATETSRAEAAGALCAPIANPTFTGTVTLPSGTALVAPGIRDSGVGHAHQLYLSYSESEYDRNIGWFIWDSRYYRGGSNLHLSYR